MIFLFVLLSLWSFINCQYVFRQSLTYAANYIEVDETGDYAIIAEDQTIIVIEYTGFIFLFSYDLSLPCTLSSMNYENGNLVIGCGTSIVQYAFSTSALTDIQNVTVPSTVMAIDIHSTEMIAAGALDGKLIILDGSTQTIQASPDPLECVAISDDKSIVVTGGQQLKVFIYGRENSGTYSLSHTINLGIQVYSVEIWNGKIFVGGDDGQVRIYDSATFSQIQVLTTSFGLVKGLSVDGNGETITIMSQNSIETWKYSQNDSSFFVIETSLSGVPNLHDIVVNTNGTMMITTILGSHAELYIGCNVADCFQCASENTCLTCQYGVDDAGNCLQPPPPENPSTANPLHNEERCYRYEDNVCVEYCPNECQSCDENRNCLNCTQFYQMNEEGKCQLVSVWLNGPIIINTFMNGLRFRNLKFIFFAADNFWLYEYHSPEYSWLAENIFGAIRLIESKKQEIINPEKLPFIKEHILPTFPNYYPYANEKYKRVEGKDSFFFRSTLEYFIMVIPYTIIMFMLLNRFFYFLFEYEISKYLRMFSFWGFLLFMGLQSNIQFFTFLGFRNFHTMFSFNFTHKVYLSFFLLFMFFVVLFAVGGFFLMYYLYGKLAKYFLDNLYRIKGAFFLMTYIYGLRPFLKGIIHSELYSHNTTQLICLACVEFFACFVMVLSEVRNGVYIFKTVFLFELVFYFSLGLFNLALLFSIHTSLEKNMEAVDQCLLILTIVITFSAAMRFILNLLMCRSITQKDPFNKINKKQKTILIKNENKEGAQEKVKEEKKEKKSKEKKKKDKKETKQNEKSKEKMKKSKEKEKKEKGTIFVECIENQFESSTKQKNKHKTNRNKEKSQSKKRSKKE